ncbi:MAG: hypothetical protein H0T62_06245 [Parachlamydiaceae bacterium]|nr:hypothetical protein [Parachlamydiaceae bacterium]
MHPFSQLKHLSNFFTASQYMSGGCHCWCNIRAPLAATASAYPVDVAAGILKDFPESLGES